MQDKLLDEFPEVSYEAWRAQVEKDLKGAAFDKRLVTRTLEGFAVEPLYTGNTASEADPGGFSGLPDYRRGRSAVGSHGRQWDVRAEVRASSIERARRELAEDLGGGARSVWLRFDAAARGAPSGEPDGVPCTDVRELQAVLEGVDLEQVPLALDAGGNVAAAALLLAAAPRARAELGCDPLGALARDGQLPFALDRAAALCGELMRSCADAPQLRAAVVSTEAYHAAGAHAVQELAYALSTGLSYLRWGMAAGLNVDGAAQQIGFTLAVGSDLFLELAKLRALRVCWAKVVAAHGGGASGQNTSLHAVTALRTKTQRDPWVNMLRGTTEAFAAMVGGADALTTRGFDEVIGTSDAFARRIARNLQNILNDEAHVTHVADAAGGSYYVEKLTDELARAAWSGMQEIERRGGMAAALSSGAIAREVAETAQARGAAIAKRSQPITGVSEYANLSEEPVQRAGAKPSARATPAAKPEAAAPLVQLRAASAGGRISAAVNAARAGASLRELTQALAGADPGARAEALPSRRHAEPYEGLRARAERQLAKTQTPARAFLCNLGEIPQHKARASFAAGLLNAGGIVALDNDGFATRELALEAFAASGANTVVVCGADEQYPEWLPTLVPALRERGAAQVVVAGRPGEQQAAWQAAGVTHFIFVGVDVVATLGQLLDGMGVAP